jgi:hypothetical protein
MAAIQSVSLPNTVTKKYESKFDFINQLERCYLFRIRVLEENRWNLTML